MQHYKNVLIGKKTNDMTFCSFCVSLTEGPVCRHQANFIIEASV